MTVEEMRAIVARHEARERLLGGSDGQSPHDDRGALLDLLRRVAAAGYESGDAWGYPECHYCSAEPSYGADGRASYIHTSNCVAPLLDALR